MKNSIKVLQQLVQKTLPIFCDEGAYRIVIDIYLKCPYEFKMLVPCLGAIHKGRPLKIEIFRPHLLPLSRIVSNGNTPGPLDVRSIICNT